MKADYETLLFRIKDDPIAHLGRCEVDYISSYFIGYEVARRAWQQTEVPRRLDWEKFRAWQESKVHLCNQNLESFCRLLTDSEETAFNLFFALFETALKENENKLVDHKFEIKQIRQYDTEKKLRLIDFIRDPEFRKRPAMYFGNNGWLGSFWAMCNGFVWAEKDMGLVNSSDATTLRKFQTWLDERYPIGKGRNWGRLLDFLALHSNQGGFDQFYEEFEMFLAGEPPDASPQWIKEAVESALKNQRKTKN